MNSLKISFMILAFLSCASTLFADTPTAKPEGTFADDIELSSSEIVTGGYALVIPKGTAGGEKRPFSHLRLSDEGGIAIWKLSVKLHPEDYLADASIAFVVTTSSGETIATPVGTVNKSQEQELESMPECLPINSIIADEELDHLDNVRLDKYVQIHQGKRDSLKRQLMNLLTRDVLNRLITLEKRYGFLQNPRISQAVPAEELLSRLQIIRLMQQSSPGRSAP